MLIGLACTLPAQDKQGNIVEYFGKEKVEEIHEGKAIHVFQDGLLLSQRRSRFNSSSVPKSVVFSRFLLEDLETVTEGQSFGDDATDNPMIWKKISSGEKNEFRDNGLRSGYLYLEYNSRKAQNVLFEASGHTMALINGLPHEGDHYDFGYNLIPMRLKKGKNIFVLLWPTKRL